MKNEKQRTYNRNFLEALKNAIAGIRYTIKTQSSIKKQIVIGIIVLVASCAFHLSQIEYLFLIIAMILVWLAELLNTAIETVVDMITDVYHPKAKIAKDIGAGAALLASIHAIIVGWFLFGTKIIIWIGAK